MYWLIFHLIVTPSLLKIFSFSPNRRGCHINRGWYVRLLVDGQKWIFVPELGSPKLNQLGPLSQKSEMLNCDIFKRRFIVLSGWGFEATVTSVFLRAFCFFFLGFCATILPPLGLPPPPSLFQILFLANLFFC